MDLTCSNTLRATAVAVLGLMVWLGFAAPAMTSPSPLTIDLLTDANVRIDGGLAGHSAGNSVAGLGNMSNDGFDDVAVGAPLVDNNGRPNSGSAYAVFGLATETTLDLYDLRGQGIRWDGAVRDDNTGWSVANAGDVNGDGLNDVIIGAPSAETVGRGRTGAAFVFFGMPSTGVFDLANIGTPGNEGFRIDGVAPASGAGRSVAGAGYVNDDNFADVIVGAPTEKNPDGLDAGAAHVVFGKPTNERVDLASLGDQGYRIAAGAAYDYAGTSVAGVDDMNGDGHDDIAVGAPNAEPDGARPDSGGAYIVWGKSSSEPISLGSLGEQGFAVIGASAPDSAGSSVAGAGDVNGNGRPDVVLGADNSANQGRTGSGSAYVVYDKTSADPVDLAALDDKGFEIDGASGGDRAGWSVAGAGDVDGGGRADVVVGAPFADNNGRPESGSAYVVSGETPPRIVDLNDPGNHAFRIDGAAAENRTGYSVAGAGNVNGDSHPDVIVGAPLADHNGTDSGSAYIVYGPNRVTDPVCSPHDNQFGAFDFDYATPDSPYAYAVSGVSASVDLCGSEIVRASSYAAGRAGTQMVGANINMPPGVAVNGADALADGSYVGTANINLLTWSGDSRSPLFVPNVSLTLTVDKSLGTDCPVDAVVCYRGQETGATSVHSWLWGRQSAAGGMYALTLGELHNDSFPSSPAGYTKIQLDVCAYEGAPGTDSCGSDSQPWLLRNGPPGETYYDYANCANATPSYCPVDPPSGCASGRYHYTVTATTRDGRTTQPAYRCYGWDYRLTPPTPPRGGRGAPAKPKQPHGGRRPPKPSPPGRARPPR